MKISVVIAAYNESDFIADCLNSVKFADEVLVIDDNSTDDTALIAKQHGAIVIKRKLDGFATQKNFGIDKTKNDWVLILDADERISAELASEIQALTKPRAAAYSMPFKNFIGKKLLRHGGLYPDHHTRLFNKKLARYGQREIHEMLDIKGEVAKLNGPVIHLTYANYREYYQKVKRYAALEAKVSSDAPSVARIVKEFGHRYLKLRGYKDGFAGLVSAVLLAYYQLELRRLRRESI